MGSNFKIFLPALEQTVCTTHLEYKSPPIERGTETVLLVEDEISVRVSLRRNLERLGYKIIETNGPSDALWQWKEHKDSINLLITDMMMPGGMTGLELAQILHTESPRLPVILISGYSKSFAQSKPESEPYLDFLQKPFEIADLASLLRKKLDAQAK
jgi:DNA-binding NtrC family response regulator